MQKIIITGSALLSVVVLFCGYMASVSPEPRVASRWCKHVQPPPPTSPEVVQRFKMDLAKVASDCDKALVINGRHIDTVTRTWVEMRKYAMHGRRALQ